MNLRLSRSLRRPLTLAETATVDGADPILRTLTSARLQLRWLEVEDIDALFDVFSDPQSLRFWNQPPFQSRDDASIHLEAIQSDFERGIRHQWGVALAATGEIIGTCSLSRIDAVQGRAEISFMIAHAHRGQRYGHELLQRLLDHAFGDLQMRRIETDIDPRNQHALALLGELGFKREGYLRQRWQVDGEIQDSILLGLLENEHSRSG